METLNFKKLSTFTCVMICRTLYLSLAPLCIIVFMLTPSSSRGENAAVTCRLSRESLNSGFHRMVETGVDLVLGGIVDTDCDCLILLKEQLPSGLYVDTYQTDTLHQHGAAKVFSPTEIDLEQPEFMSPAHEVYVYQNTTKSDAGRGLHADVSLPVHMRYHRPRADVEFLPVSLQPPDVLVRCSTCDKWLRSWPQVTAPCPEAGSISCDWHQLQCSGAQELTFQVPVGQLDHFLVVTVTTLLVSFISTAAIIVVMQRTSRET